MIFESKTRVKLSTKINTLAIGTSIAAIMIMASIFITLFVFYFASSTREDMEYVLENTNQQFHQIIQFIQDGAVSIRHNNVIGEFFNKNHYDEEKVQEQLEYSMDLFSERNIGAQNLPYVSAIYLFNNKGDFVRRSYYPTTLAVSKKKDLYYSELKQKFEDSNEQIRTYMDEEELELCFRIYDDDMKRMGICIVTLQIQVLKQVFEEIEKYNDFCWMITSNRTDVVASGGTKEQIEDLQEIGQNFSGIARINKGRVICNTTSSGFYMGASVSIGYYNIFTILGPALMSIVIALILVLALSPMFALRVGRRFLKPFENMAEEIQAFGEENLNARMQDFDIQEFHDISVVFNGMADHIEYLITQVYEKQLLATESQVKFLQAQIQPHFQFNILAMLSVKAKLAGNEELYQLTNAFSKLIQGKIFREKEIKITLADEMELVEFYLFLQKGRYNEKLNYSIYYGKDDVKECLIPRLLIEPLVENAVSHGLEPKSGVGHIDIQIFCQDGQLHVMVRDDGVGFEIGKVEQKNESEHTHTGIANTKRLLEILYKGNYQMHVDGQAGKGTCVEIILPEERICKSCGK